jgi:hypothetical protein
MLPWDDAPDVDWTCMEHEGRALLVIQATGPALSGTLLSHKLARVDVRFIFDDEKLPDLVPKQFICIPDGDALHPILTCDPDPMLYPLRLAVTMKKPWWLILQVVVDGKPHMKMLTVNPDGTTGPAKDPAGEYPAGQVWPKWLVGIR